MHYIPPPIKLIYFVVFCCFPRFTAASAASTKAERWADIHSSVQHHGMSLSSLREYFSRLLKSTLKAFLCILAAFGPFSVKSFFQFFKDTPHTMLRYVSSFQLIALCESAY